MTTKLALGTSVIVFCLSLTFCSNLHYAFGQPTSFSDWSSPTPSDLFSVFMLNNTYGYAVGANGTIVHWNGSQWLNVMSPTTTQLNSVYLTSESDGWAVGFLGTIVRWNGTAWRNFQCPTQSDLWSVGMINGTYGWAVGYGGTIIQWNGTEWTNVTSPTIHPLYSISAVDANDAWAVGPEFIHWNGTMWTVDPNAGGIPYPVSVCMVNSSYGWAAGSLGTMWQWNGTEWAEISVGGTMYVFFSIFLTNASDGWAVGEWGTLKNDTAGVALHWDGNYWNFVGASRDVPLYSVFILNSSDGWIVGALGTVNHWDGVEWTVPEFQTYATVTALIGSSLIPLAYLRKTCSRKEHSPQVKQLN